MAIKAVSQLPDPIQPLADADLLFLTQYDADSEQFVSVQLPLSQLKDYVNGGTPEPISCEGATSLIHFPSLTGEWSLAMDGDDLVIGDASDLTNYILANFDGVLTSDYDGYFRIVNLDSIPHRFHMVPSDGASYGVPDAEGTTPTFQENGDGSLDFCLAAAE